MAQALREADAEVRFLFIGGRGELEADLVPAAGIPFHATAMPSLRDPDSRFSLVTRAFVMPIAAADAFIQIVRFRPDVCCTTGGLVSLPIVLAARAARVPVYIWEGNAVPGRVNRLLAGWSQRIGATFEASLRALPRSRTTVAGNPIRRSLLQWTRASGREKLGLPAEGPVVFVTGGSQGSAVINHAVSGALPRLLRRTVLIHHTGNAHLAQAAAKRDTLPAELRERYQVHGFLREEMGAALASADLVLGRASSSSIAEPLAFGVPLVLVPFAAAADAHQTANARDVAEKGAAIVLRESELDADRLVAVVTGLLDDGARLSRMAKAARAAGRPDAATAIANEIRALGGCA
ncbi:MAG TPA: UDP-N-acetylglucosamine--N-acetylmuramyl-(pentapeptide) pyrophosphoryl-undecaprenol N-acetylglucosamine transferase [Candidatus Limnocylindria bacterium]|nr:UDP-N-acetylglucosamine--N-acetylmuramyl-(pentapeptide) pyrophosphoryl-undecaprenol N-acetylglucosamine transferase [Candidatus Limnocylindria bacterium]